MKPQQVYQAVLGMVIGLSILSYLVQLPLIAYIALTLAFLTLVSETLGRYLVGTMHAVISYIFGWALKAILVIVYLLLLTPIALLRRRARKAEGWQAGKVLDESQMKYTW